MAKYHIVEVTYCGGKILLNMDLEELGVSHPLKITRENVIDTMKKCGYLPNNAEENEIIFSIKPHGGDPERR